ncbi:MAG: hypothetical protein EAZ24_02510 [Burkholderiales bacterium]|nr:MAG: hypothetical protein EAZ21_02860 [Betaproteobacteria bacterium]TAG83888.1 MAG: hypothetical protein EAZ24_02510 [Burkholderiales bacterium]
MGWPIIVLLALALWGAYNGYTTREIKHPPGVIAPDAPVQRNFENGKAFQIKDFTITPRAKFSLTARVLARERYRSDAAADIIPIDIAFGWGPMSDTALIDKLKISQSGRFYFWGYQGQPPAAHEVIIRSSANMHLIPADSITRERLLDARVGDVLELEGELVDVKRSNGWNISTSLTRDDSGGGACEVIYVRHVIARGS